MKKSFIMAFVMLTLTGCDYGKAAFEQHLNNLMGRSPDAAFITLGMPTSEGQVAGKKYYEWSTFGAGILPTTVSVLFQYQIPCRHNIRCRDRL